MKLWAEITLKSDDIEWLAEKISEKMNISKNFVYRVLDDEQYDLLDYYKKFDSIDDIRNNPSEFSDENKNRLQELGINFDEDEDYEDEEVDYDGILQACNYAYDDASSVSAAAEALSDIIGELNDIFRKVEFISNGEGDTEIKIQISIADMIECFDRNDMDVSFESLTTEGTLYDYIALEINDNFSLMQPYYGYPTYTDTDTFNQILSDNLDEIE